MKPKIASFQCDNENWMISGFTAKNNVAITRKTKLLENIYSLLIEYTIQIIMIIICTAQTLDTNIKLSVQNIFVILNMTQLKKI